MDEAGKDLIRRACRNSIEHALHKFLSSLQGACVSEEITVTIDGESIADLDEDLVGALFGEEGWFGRFSKYGPE